MNKYKTDLGLLHVTHHTRNAGKMTGMVSLNTSTVGNPFCEKMLKVKGATCQFCYARKLQKVYGKYCTECFQNNGKILSGKKLRDSEIPMLNYAYFRFNAYGELINATHLHNLYRMVEANPTTRFSLWTKRKELIKSSHGFDNFNLIYSTIQLNGQVRLLPHFDKCFTVYTPEFAKANGVNINCGAKQCLTCLKCYEADTEEFINETLRK